VHIVNSTGRAERNKPAQLTTNQRAEAALRRGRDRYTRYIQDWVAHQTHANSTTLRMKTEMVFETSVSTKVEPYYSADNPKELLR
jgi:hypothetical protein